MNKIEIKIYLVVKRIKRLKPSKFHLYDVIPFFFKNKCVWAQIYIEFGSLDLPTIPIFRGKFAHENVQINNNKNKNNTIQVRFWVVENLSVS